MLYEPQLRNTTRGLPKSQYQILESDYDTEGSSGQPRWRTHFFLLILILILKDKTQTLDSSVATFTTMTWRPAVMGLILIFALVIFEEWVSIPSCKLVPTSSTDLELDLDHPDDLKVMLVANLLLLGSESSFFNSNFRDYYLSKFFRVFSLFCIICTSKKKKSILLLYLKLIIIYLILDF